jgi:cytochrome P450
MKPIIKRFQSIFLKQYYKNKKDLLLSKSSINDLDNISDYSFLNHFGNIHYFEKDKVWLATGNDEINYILKNEQLFTTSELYKYIDHLDILMGELNERNQMIRKMIKEIISVKLFAELEIFIKSESEQLLNNLLEKNQIHFQKEFSEKITLEVMCFVFGFRNELTKDILKKYEPQIQDFENIMQFFDLIYTNNIEFQENRLADQLKKLIVEKTISAEEASIISRIVWFGGIDTTSKLISNLLIGLYQDKNVTSKLENDPKLHSKYIEENLRLSPPVEFVQRFIKSDTNIGKTKLTKGSIVFLDIRLGNRDPKIFESAEQLSFEQNKNRHLSFGNGVHQCLGMGLARFEAKLLLTDLFKVYNKFEIEDIKYRRDIGVVIINRFSTFKLRKNKNI